jgi:hypothetical protein
MSGWRDVLRLRLRSLFRANTVERELDEELRYHLERQTELNVASGMDPVEARRAALRAMGGVEQHKEVCRDQRRVRIADNLIRDTQYGLRLLKRSPIFTIVAILSLALGIGANAAIFQLIDTIRLRSLAIPNPQELAEVQPDGPQAFGHYEGVNAKATYPLWELIHANQTAFSAMFVWGDAQFNVGRGAEARPARGLWVSGDFFPVSASHPFVDACSDRLTIAEDAATVPPSSVTRSGRPLSVAASPRLEARSRFWISRSPSSAWRRRRSPVWKSVRRSTSRCRVLRRTPGRASRAAGPLVADDHGPAQA